MATVDFSFNYSSIDTSTALGEHDFPTDQHLKETISSSNSVENVINKITIFKVKQTQVAAFPPA